MPEDLKYDVFLSHSRNDKTLARPIAGRLKKDGLNVWLSGCRIDATSKAASPVPLWTQMPYAE
jgi:hypothetical protein